MHSQQANRMISYYAKLLLLFSIILIIYGISLEFNNRSRYSSPVRNKNNPQDFDGVFVTPVDGSEVVSNGEANVQGNVVGDDTSIDQMNSLLRKEIEDTYGITVFYGNETDGYKVSFDGKSISTYAISDKEVIYSQLSKLKSVLSLYPKKLFFEIRDGGIPLTVYLINHYSDNGITGITDSNYQYANISIAALYSFEESFYHESYHYIERYLLKKGANFNSWTVLNPKNFHYGTVMGELSYSNTFLEDSPFVNNYAQSTAGEDRASTFEYMMASSKASCLNQKNYVWYKAKYMALMIETVLDSVKPDTVEYWERFL